MVKNKLNSDKYVVYVMRPSTRFPLIKINRCDEYGKIIGDIDTGGYMIDDPERIGRAIIDNSKIIKRWNAKISKK